MTSVNLGAKNLAIDLSRLCMIYHGPLRDTLLSRWLDFPMFEEPWLGGTYLSLINMVRKSSKNAIIQLHDIVKEDVRQITSLTQRTSMMLTGNDSIEQLDDNSGDIEYHEIPNSKTWTLKFIFIFL